MAKKNEQVTPASTDIAVVGAPADIAPTADEVLVKRLFAAYRELWMSAPQALTLILDFLAEQGFGAVHGFLVPDGSYFNEQTGEIDGKVNKGDRVWTRESGWAQANESKGV